MSSLFSPRPPANSSPPPQPQTAPNTAAKVGDLKVEVLKASGDGLLKGVRAKCTLQLGSVRLQTESAKVSRDKSGVVWERTQFVFAIAQPTDSLLVILSSNNDNKDDPKSDLLVGRTTIALNHLPSGRVVEKWYQLSNKDNSNAAVVLIRIDCSLSYSMARNITDQGMTVFPSSRGAISSNQPESLMSKLEKEPSPRFIDYFVVVGVPTHECNAVGKNYPRILERFPFEDRADFPMPVSIPPFCFPGGFKISTSYKESVSFSFKLTDGMVSVYGQVLTFWSEIPFRFLRQRGDHSQQNSGAGGSLQISIDPNSDSQSASSDSDEHELAANSSSVVYIPKSICVLSRYPYLPQYRASLAVIYQKFLQPYERKSQDPINSARSKSPNSQMNSSLATDSDLPDHTALEQLSDVEDDEEVSIPSGQNSSRQTKDLNPMLERFAEKDDGEEGVDYEASSHPVVDTSSEAAQAELSPSSSASLSTSTSSKVPSVVPQSRATSAGSATLVPSPSASKLASTTPKNATLSGAINVPVSSSSPESSPEALDNAVRAATLSPSGSKDIFANLTRSQTATKTGTPSRSGSSFMMQKLAQDRAAARARQASVEKKPSEKPEVEEKAKLEKFKEAQQRKQSKESTKLTTTKVFSKPEWLLDPEGRSLEQYIILICDEIPLPVPGKTSIGFRIGDFPIHISLPPRELEFPQLELPLEALFRILDMRTVLQIMCCIFTECQILFHSTQYSLLLFVQEAILSLCFPFEWEHVYIPLLPKDMLNVIQAPVPFIVGIHTDILPEDLDELSQSSTVVLVDIDRNEIDSHMPPPFFPKPQSRTLIRSLMGLIRPQTFTADLSLHPTYMSGLKESTAAAPSKPTALTQSTSFQSMYPLPPSASLSSGLNALAGLSSNANTIAPHKTGPDSHIWNIPINPNLQRAIRSTFLHFIADLLKDYRNFVFFVNGQKPIFNTAKFLHHHKHSLQFLSRFLETQLFTNFLEKHVESPGYLDDYLNYVDNPTAGKLRKDNTAFSGGVLTFMVPVPPRFPIEDHLAKLEKEATLNSSPRGAHPVLSLGLRPSMLLKERFSPPRKFNIPLLDEESESSSSDSDSDSDDESSKMRVQTKHRSGDGHDCDTLQLPSEHKRKHSGRLYIKSLIEQSKDIEESRLHQLLRRILLVGIETGVAGEADADADIGELSAVGELLKFEYWRSAFVAYFVKNKIGETRCASTSFKAFTLLFNIAIEESYVENDYKNARALLDFSSKIYYVSEEHNPANVHERDYLCYALKSQQMWQEHNFWNYSFGSEVDKHNAEVAVKASSEAKSHGTKGVSSEPKEEWELFLFDLLGKFSYTMASMGLQMEMTQQFVTNQCNRYHLNKDQAATLVKLVQNIYLSAPPSTMRSSSVTSSSNNMTPIAVDEMTTPRRRASSTVSGSPATSPIHKTNVSAPQVPPDEAKRGVALALLARMTRRDTHA